MRGVPIAMPDDFESRALESRPALAARYGVSEQTISRWRARVGKLHVPAPPPADFAEYAPGRGRLELRKRYRAGDLTIKRWRQECGIEAKSSIYKAIAARIVPAPADLAGRFAEIGTFLGLAQHYGRDRKTIIRWLSAAGLLPKKRAPQPKRHSAPHHHRIRLVPGQVVLPAFRNAIPPARAGREEDAAHHLRRACAVYHCTETGRADPKGKFWRVGSAVLRPDELIERAYSKGWDPEQWRRVA